MVIYGQFYSLLLAYNAVLILNVCTLGKFFIRIIVLVCVIVMFGFLILSCSSLTWYVL